MPLRLGFVGAGFMGQQAHIQNYVHLPDVELTALAEPKAATAAAVAKRWGINDVFDSHQSLLTKANVDAVVAILPFGLHHAIVPDILRAGKHCLTEKPIGQNPETAKATAQLADDQGVIYHVGYMKRCDPAARFTADMIRDWRHSEPFGPLRHLRVSMPPGDWIYGMEPGIRIDETASATAAAEPTPAWMDKTTSEDYIRFVNYYIHQVNLVRFLLGEDYTIRYADKTGVVLVAESDSGVPITFEMAAYEMRDEWRETCTASFASGQVELHLPAPLARQPGTVQIYKNTEPHPIYEQPVMPPTWSMREQARLFVESIQNGTPTISSAWDAVKDLETAEDFIRLHQSNQ